MLNSSSPLQLQVERIATLLGAACLGRLHASHQQESRSSSGTQHVAPNSHLLVSEDIYLVSGQQPEPVCWSSLYRVIPSAQECQASLLLGRCLETYHIQRGFAPVTMKPSTSSGTVLYMQGLTRQRRLPSSVQQLWRGARR